MRDRATLIAPLSVTYLAAGGETETTQEDALRALLRPYCDVDICKSDERM